MVREHTITTVEKPKGETQEHINICRRCPYPISECNGECNYYREKAKKLRETKRIKKNIVIY